jgi:hypothetical protein
MKRRIVLFVLAMMAGARPAAAKLPARYFEEFAVHLEDSRLK